MEVKDSLDVVRIVKNSLGIDGFDYVSTSSPISGLVKNVDRSDMVDILYKSGVYRTDDFSCGELNDNGRNFLREVGVKTEKKANWVYWYILAASRTSDVLNQLTCKDIYDMVLTRGMLN